MHTNRIGIFGATGYSGMELTRLIATHGGLEAVFLASERYVGAGVEPFTGVTGPVGRMSYTGFEESMDLAAGCDAVLLATPAEVSGKLAPALRARGVKVVDLSGAFRLQDAAQRARHYPGVPSENLDAVYAIPELARDAVRGAGFVSNPGCYPTAATLALAPLLSGGWIQRDVVVNALSGASGAGRKASEDYSLVELYGDVKAYRVLAHQHAPEIAQNLSAAAGGQPVELTFTPHLLPVPRGILCTAYARLARPADAAALTQALRSAYRGEPFVRVVERPEQVSLKAVVGTNQCWIGAACEPSGRVVVVSAIDNLVKGAAGQALQNLNLMLGHEESAGLASLRRFHP